MATWTQVNCFWGVPSDTFIWWKARIIKHTRFDGLLFVCLSISNSQLL